MSKLILGIDSSLSCPAFSVVKVTDGKAEVVELSHIKTNNKKSTGYRLWQIYVHFKDILDRYDFDEIVIEKGFNRFAVATQQIQRTVGLLLFTLYRKEVEEIHELAPTSVKKYITGDGKASKEKLANGLENYVGKIKYKNNDESDATGVALALAIQKGWL
ncbi:crossover junction endodeoxyribonuclease RuvC [Bacillus cereus group sp. Bc015]|uniref:crossover junction endodeoxyribonuclease RuvC n=1 Tax=Bacillus cereus group sp. Bc015 TaxID=3018123 RepID=UPI0022E3AF37|nr:crossover junction endodeoxyribonuclease RuvC [Bacillus cereus group sp. Bc015]MDA2738433.1 crossover junction endodeoxyribonuclease RuvC [Bacillus cereus group sp. Bc015]